jgi:hypothetical protein
VQALKKSATKRNRLEYFMSRRYEGKIFPCVIGITKAVPITFVV